LKQKNVFVTGADGFIGSHLVERLVGGGYNVTALVQYNSYNSWGWLERCDAYVRENTRVLAGDIRDVTFLKSIMKGSDAVIHLAALIAIPYSYKSPRSYVETNVLGTLNVLEAAVANDVQRFIQTSTSEVYGSAEFLPMSENHQLRAQSPYAATKIASDQLALSFYLTFGLPVVTIRPFNTFGPRQSGRAIIPSILLQVLAGKERIFLGNTDSVRDFSYVKDTVGAFKTVLESDAGIGKFVNFGTGVGFTIRDVVEIVSSILRKPLIIELDPQRVRPEKSEVDHLLADISQAKQVYNWMPDYLGADGFRAALEETIDWFSVPGNLALYKANDYNV
jgi:NAD dependent epimerase/dehydratase